MAGHDSWHIAAHVVLFAFSKTKHFEPGRGAVKERIRKNWFFWVLALIFVLTVLDIPKCFSIYGAVLKENHGPDVAIILIFFFSGLTLNSRKIFSGLQDYQSILIALGVIFIAAPVFASVFSLLPLNRELLTGLFLVSVMPSTLSSGVVMTGKAGGNIVTALMITIVAGIVAVFTVPVSLELLLKLTGTSSGIEINKLRIIIKIGAFVVVPLISGILVRYSSRSYFEKYEKVFSLFNQWFVLCIIWMAASQTRGIIIGNSEQIPIIISVVVVFHVLLTGFAFMLTKVFRLMPGNRESVIFMGGQKTLPLSVMLQISFFSHYPVVLVVCVLHHAIHLMMDSYLAGMMEGAANISR